MTTAELKKAILRAAETMPPARLKSLADYAAFLAGDRLRKEIAAGEKTLTAGKAVNWRTVRKDV